LSVEPTQPARDYDPLHPRGGIDWRSVFARIWAPIAALIGIAVKFGFLFAKFGLLFVSVGGYALLWGWQFAIGLVAMILVHEFGHFFEAKRQGLHVSLPNFIPFLGAYVTIKDAPRNPWKNALVALAGPAAGGVAALVTLGLAEHYDSRSLHAIAYTGFFLNLFNLIPFGIFDGGAIWRSIQLARRVPNWTPELAATAPYSSLPGGGPQKAFEITLLYIGLAALLVLGMYAAHVPQHRL
jgi:Zn-dependent protease